MILADIGEIGIHDGGAVYKLRPSFYAVSKLGTPSEIVQIFANIHSEHFTKRGKTEQFAQALGVLAACSEDGLDIFGSYAPAAPGKLGSAWRPGRYTPGKGNPRHVLTLARSLLAHGVVGDVPELPRRADAEPEYHSEFNARDHVATAMAHLGLTEHEAWNMTMTGLVLALRSKYPTSDKDAPGRKAPTKAEYEATMAWADKIDAMRNKNV